MNKYRAFYPRTFDEAIEMVTRLIEEEDGDTDYVNGYRCGLRIGRCVLRTLKDNMGEAEKK